MNDARAIAFAVVVGAIVEMPVGPVAVLCIRQAIVVGPLAGLVTALAPALADSLYGALGIVGSRGPLLWLAPHRSIVHVAVGLLLVALAVYFGRSALRPPAIDSAAAGALARGMAPALLLSFSNPAALVVAAAIFASAGVGTVRANDYPFVVVALFVGAMAWWTLIAAVAARVRKYATALILRAMYIICALAFCAAGLLSLIGAR